jgi:hypothetical protein
VLLLWGIGLYITQCVHRQRLEFTINPAVTSLGNDQVEVTCLQPRAFRIEPVYVYPPTSGHASGPSGSRVKYRMTKGVGGTFDIQKVYSISSLAAA